MKKQDETAALLAAPEASTEQVPLRVLIDWVGEQMHSGPTRWFNEQSGRDIEDPLDSEMGLPQETWRAMIDKLQYDRE
jgi:hypothetical protein